MSYALCTTSYIFQYSVQTPGLVSYFNLALQRTEHYTVSVAGVGYPPPVRASIYLTRSQQQKFVLLFALLLYWEWRVRADQQRARGVACGLAIVVPSRSGLIKLCLNVVCDGEVCMFRSTSVPYARGTNLKYIGQLGELRTLG